MLTKDAPGCTEKLKGSKGEVHDETKDNVKGRAPSPASSSTTVPNPRMIGAARSDSTRLTMPNNAFKCWPDVAKVMVRRPTSVVVCAWPISRYSSPCATART